MSERKGLTISLETARAMAVKKQGLDKRPPASNKADLLDAIRRIGLLQLDSVSVVARSHYLVMLSRLGAYDRTSLDELLHPDRQLFEGWAHAACLIPVEDFPYFVPGSLERRKQPLGKWQRQALGENPEALMESVLEEIRTRGALGSKDFEDSRDHREPWWGFKPAKHALVHLFRRGQLMVDRRRNFQILYDLPERVLPGSTKPAAMSLASAHRWATEKGLAHLGVATAPQVCDYYRIKVSVVRGILNELVEEGRVVPVEIPGWREMAYVRLDDMELLQQVDRGQHRAEVTTFLSPFDNLTWKRERLKELFEFEYALEIYVPKAKRVTGYYVMPILHNGRLVGRLDPKADRKNKSLIIHKMLLEDGVPVDEPLLSGLAGALQEFMLFHRCERIVIEHTQPRMLLKALSARI